MSSNKLMQKEHWSDTEIDGQTGEILKHHEVEHIKFKSVPQTEENFIKVYYNTYLALMDYNHSSLSYFLMVLGKYMSYSKDGQIVCLYKSVKEEIATSLGISVVRVNQMIKDCIELGIIERKDRGVYSVSPFVISKGNWKETSALQIEYNDKAGKMLISSVDKLEGDTK